MGKIQEKFPKTLRPTKRYKPNSLKRFEECLNGIVCYWPWITISTNGNICYSNLLDIHLFDLMFNIICSDVVVEQVTANNEMSLSCFVNDIECHSSDPNSHWLKLFSFVSSLKRKCTRKFRQFYQHEKKISTSSIWHVDIWMDSLGVRLMEISISNHNLNLIASFVWSSFCANQQNPQEKIVTSSIFNLFA